MNKPNNWTVLNRSEKKNITGKGPIWETGITDAFYDTPGHLEEEEPALLPKKICDNCRLPL